VHSPKTSVADLLVADAELSESIADDVFPETDEVWSSSVAGSNGWILCMECDIADKRSSTKQTSHQRN